MSDPTVSRTERSGLRFDLSWDTRVGYRVSTPQLLNNGERLTVMPEVEHEALRSAARELVEVMDRIPPVCEAHCRAIRKLEEALDA